MGEFFKKPSWKRLAQEMGCEDAENPENSLPHRPKRSAPSFQDCKDHSILITQRMMGLSCLVFYLPGMVYLHQMCLAGYTISLSSKIIGGVLCVFLAYVSSTSFLADYWYTGDDETRPDATIPEHQKQYICNAIDLTNVPFISITLILLDAFQFFYGNGYNWLCPILLLTFLGGVALQQKSLRYQEKYTAVVYEDDGSDKDGYDRANVRKKDTHNIKW